jgi:hypothetical protein
MLQANLATGFVRSAIGRIFEIPIMQSPRYTVRWLILALMAILCITFFPYLFEGKSFLPSDMFDTMMSPFNATHGPPQAQTVYYYDALLQTYPYKINTQNALRAGRLSYWSSHVLCGYPQYAETMGNNFDVTNIFLLWMTIPSFLLLQTLIELLIAGVGMVLLLRFFAVRPVVNLIFAAAYMLNSLFISTALNRWLVASFCWVPFVILMTLKYLQSNDWKNILYASIFLALAFLGGNFQTAFFALFLVAAVILWYPATAQSVLRRCAALATLGCTAFALSGVMWLPSLELFHLTISTGSLNSSSIYRPYSVLQRIISVPLLIMFYLPTLLGSPEIFSPKKVAGVDVTDFNGAIAFLPALFAVAGCVLLWHRKELRVFIVLALSAVMLPLFTPLYSYLYHRFFIVASFCFAVIGAVTLESFLDAPEKCGGMVKWTIRGFVVLCIVLVLLCLATLFGHNSLHAQLQSGLASMIQHTTYGGGNPTWMYDRIDKTLAYYSFTSLQLWLPILSALVAIVALSRYRASKLSQGAFLGIAFTTSVLQLILFARMWLPAIDASQFPIYPKSATTEFLSKQGDSRYAALRNQTDPLILQSNSSVPYGLFDVFGYESLTCPSVSSLYRSRASDSTVNARLLGLASCDYIITHSLRPFSVDARLVLEADGLTVFKNHLAKPRAYYASSSRSLPNRAAIDDELLKDGFDGSSALFNGSLRPLIASTNYDTSGTIEIATATDNELVIHARSAAAALLILTDTYYPGWVCEVNGEPQQIYCVNNYMRGVFLKTGDSRIVMKFEPLIFRIGSIISVVSLAGVAIGFVSLKRGKR